MNLEWLNNLKMINEIFSKKGFELKGLVRQSPFLKKEKKDKIKTNNSSVLPARSQTTLTDS